MEQLQATRTLHNSLRRNKGRRPGEKGQDKERTAAPASNGFLSHRFLPLVSERAQLKNWRSREQGFFTSLLHLATQYKFIPLDVSAVAYPYNIYLAYQHAKSCMEKQLADETLFISGDEIAATCLATAKAMNTGRTLYYLPLQPLYRMLREKKQRRSAQLLLSVMSYLLEVAQIPSYTSGDYVSYCHNTIEEWLNEAEGEWEEEEFKQVHSQIRMAEYGGMKMSKQMRHPYHLSEWQSRIDRFKAHSETEKEILVVATTAYTLYRQYPERRWYDYICPGLTDPQEEYRVAADQYISLTWSASGWLSDQLEDFVNTDTQEACVTDEPLNIKRFDREGGTLINSLDFEKGLLQIFETLGSLLYTIDDEQRNTGI